MRYLAGVKDLGIVLSPDSVAEKMYKWDGGGVRGNFKPRWRILLSLLRCGYAGKDGVKATGMPVLPAAGTLFTGKN